MRNLLVFQIALSITLVLGSVCGVPTAYSQDQDSTPVPVDSTALLFETIQSDTTGAVSDSLATLLAVRDSISRINSLSSVHYFPTASVYPPTHYGLELTEQLASLRGAFMYDLTTEGWPSAWTTRNRPLNSVDVSWDGLDFDELFTGRPAYELLPRGLIDTLRIGFGLQSYPLVATSTRRVSDGTPLTELTYRTSNKAGQYVYASHSQSRIRSIATRPFKIGIRTGYLGEKADGEYPGSKLQRARNVFGSLLLETGRARIEISDMVNRRRVGAHGGVVPLVSGDPNSIYQRFGAIVRDGSAERRTKRNDLTTRVSFDGRRKRTSVDWTSRRTKQFFRFRNSSDEVFVRSRRISSRLDLRRRLDSSVLGIHGQASNEKISESTFLDSVDVSDLKRYSISGSAFTSGKVQVNSTLGLARAAGESSLEASVRLSTNVNPFDFVLTLSRSVPDPAFLETVGFSKFAKVVSGGQPGYINDGRLGLRFTAAFVTFGIDAFAVVSQNPYDWFATANSDSIVYQSVGADIVTLGTTIYAGLRDNATRGFYLNADATLLDTSTPGSPTAGQVFPGDSGPDNYATVNVGLRYLLFKGDLDGDFFLRARAWPDFTGRNFHRETGLMVVPFSGGYNITSSVALDLVIQAGIRGATVLLTYENLLSGTELIIGNQLVPGYPLAQRRLRFGLFWPILN